MALSDGTARLALVSAWNDSGGGFVHRLLDGHPDAAVWPFELQLGTPLCHDALSGTIHAKYRWPVFPAETKDLDALFDLIIDDELKSVLRSTQTEKFGDFVLDVDLNAWRARFCRAELGWNPGRRRIVAAYIDAFFAEWEAARKVCRAVVGHCPNIVLDAGEVFGDFPDARMVHVTRHPVPGFGDFRRRHPGFDVRTFADRWNTVNGAAVQARHNWPSSIVLVRYEDLLADRKKAMSGILCHLQLPYDPSVIRPTWNGQALDDRAMGPFGGVPAIGLAHECEAAVGVLRDEAKLLCDLTADTQTALSASSAPIPG